MRPPVGKLRLETLECRTVPAVAVDPFELALVGRYDTGFGDTGSEIVVHDPQTQRLFAVHGIDNPADSPASSIEIIDIANPASPTLFGRIDITPYGRSANSAAFKNGVLAVAIEASAKTEPGTVAFFNANGAFLGQVTVGALPDMLTFTPDGSNVLVANEGEPNSYNRADSVDPEGSISIINLAGGPASATVLTAGFAAFNSEIDALRAQGVRIFGPNATVAQDLEPEYITTDGVTAWVTLQENNALARIDIATATVTQLIPLGYKDHSQSGPFTESYTFQNMPLLGTVNGEDIPLGGFSGLAFEGYDADGNLKFITHTDRGPNGEPPAGTINRPFLIPGFNPEVIRFTLDRLTGTLTITQRLPLSKPDGSPLTGLPNLNFNPTNGSLPHNDEVPVDANLVPLDTYDPLGADLEGIAVDPNDGTFWMVDEYRPAIYHFGADGRMIDRFIPEGTHAAAGVEYTPGTFGLYGTEALPAVLGQRRQNRGFEGVAFQSGKVYAIVQSPLRNPDSSTNGQLNARQSVRLVEFDPTTHATRQFLYRMDNLNLGPTRGDKIGDLAAVPGGGFLVVERDDDLAPSSAVGDIEKKVYKFSLAGATPITATNDILYDVGGGVLKTLDQMTLAELTAAGIAPIAKSLHTDLAKVGYNTVSKVEGLAIIDAGTIAVVNDNDFQVGSANEPTVLGLIRTNALDPSDRDNGSGGPSIKLNNWPVFGMYQPDAIASFQAGGQTYLITANEGDARDYTGFSEEVRAGASAYVLDPTAFPNASTLKNNANLGRLTVTNRLGDTDGDGDFDRIYAFGGRSFSVWSSTGELVFDSGSDLEVLTAALSPATFNSDGSASSFDTRSDNKGPEPEAVAVGEINGTNYAFIGLERIGGVMVFDVSNPAAPKFVQYINSAPTDIAPEGLIFIKAADSPVGRPLVIMANEVSGTVSIFQAMEADLAFNAPAGPAANSMVLRRNGLDLELVDQTNGTILVGQPLDKTASLAINGAADSETLTIDFAFGGSFGLPGGVTFNGRGGIDSLRFTGTDEADRVAIAGPMATFNDDLGVAWSTLEKLTIATGQGDDHIEMTGRPLDSRPIDLHGGDGDDAYALGTSRTRTRLHETAGVDTLDFTPSAVGVTVRLQRSTGQVQQIDSLGNSLVLLGQIENAVGSALGDRLTGNTLANALWGMGGNDWIDGNSGDDYMDGGEGNDQLFGGAGRDLLLGRAGDDELVGGLDRDVAIGGLGADTLRGRLGGDILIGGRTVHDDDRPALAGILEIWASSDSYESRVAQLQEGLLAAENVFDDETADTLVGRVGLDWIFPEN